MCTGVHIYPLMCTGVHILALDTTNMITIILPCPDNRDIDKDIKKFSDNRYQVITTHLTVSMDTREAVIVFLIKGLNQPVRSAVIA